MAVQLRDLTLWGGANANLAALGLVAADMTPVTTAQTGWATAFPAHMI